MKIDPNLKKDLKEYLQLRLKEQNQVVHLISSYEFGEDELAALKSALPMLGKAHIIKTTDPTILGGFILKFGSKMIDLSLKSELQKLQQKLYEIS